LRADILGDPNAPAGKKGTPATSVRGLQWMNPAAFAAPQAYTLGNVSRTVPKILGPGSISFDSMVGKNFTFSERLRAQFRWETFNSFNTAAIRSAQPGLRRKQFRAGHQRGRAAHHAVRVEALLVELATRR
jgi:hypothetical protein